MRVLVAIDSFKGTIGARDVARAIASGWRAVRPSDRITLLPLADGGEGTAETIAAAVPGAVRRTVDGVTGPDGRPVTAEWYELPGRIAVLDLAQMSGLPLMRTPDPMHATTRGLGETIRAALRDGAREVWVGLGGSASTDGGMGALRALGLRAVDRDGADVAEGGAGLAELVAIDTAELLPVPGGVTLLTDVVSPLTGDSGAAAVFGPQKGATPAQVRELDRALSHLAAVIGVEGSFPGAGAAGGTGYGFASVYGATIVAGAERVAELAGLDRRIADADLVITGEGSYDHQSLQGKLVGGVVARCAAADTRVALVAGVVQEEPAVAHASLTELAGSSQAAMAEPARWAEQAGSALAATYRDA